MNRFGRRFRALVGTFASAILLAQGLLVPMLEGTDGGQKVVLESKHDASCLVGHDHSICTQAGANRSIASSPAAQAFTVSTLEVVAPLGASRPPARAVQRGSRPRAPPTV